MDVLLGALANPADMSQSQLLLLAILVFVLAGAVYLAWRLFRMIVTSQKSTYVPNIGRKRLATHRTVPGNPDVQTPVQMSATAASAKPEDK